MENQRSLKIGFIRQCATWFAGCLLLMVFGCHQIKTDRMPPVNMDVMSFNIRYGLADDGENSWAYRKDLLYRVIREESPYVLGLQEALRFQIDFIRACFPQVEETGLSREGDSSGEYSPILYDRNRYHLVDSETFWLSDTPDIPSTHWGNSLRRICTWVRLQDLKSGRSFYVFNTHLDHESQLSREKSTALILDKISGREFDEPVILMGDFNAGLSNPAMLLLTGELSSSGRPLLINSLSRVNPVADTIGTFHGFTGEAGSEAIDFIFITEGFKVQHAAIVRTAENGRFPSDHFPVTARLSF